MNVSECVVYTLYKSWQSNGEGGAKVYLSKCQG